SREFLDFVPRAVAKVPWGLNALDAIDKRRKSGPPLSYQRAFWRPPLNAHEAYELECAQIRSRLGLRPLVALSDHDDLEACSDLHAIGIPVPYSLEWTVPYEATIFHLGVFNLPSSDARGYVAAMARYTAHRDPALLRELLADFDSMRDVLVVLNHPLSC